MISQQDNYKVVIAYDFGTTFSGASYAFTHTTVPEVFDIQKWPQKGGNFYPKTPSISAYKKSDPSTIVEWGHSAKKLMSKPQAAKEHFILTNFKLRLDETLFLRGSLDINKRSPVDNIADYLTCLHQHVLDEVTRGFAKNYPPETFRYCLTVPAMWSDLAKFYMRRAAIKAGLIHADDPQDRLILISEPEAAALYCERMCEQVNLKKGDRIMICDAGGGTVDLILFEVMDENIQSNHRLKEVTKGMGESCGSVFLDYNFRALLEEKLGDQVKDLPPATINNLMDQFIDNIKPEFDGLDDQYLNIPVSIDLSQLDDDCLDEGTMILRAQDLKEKVFEPVVRRVLALIEKQYNQVSDQRVSCIFLVGGFGSSNYLFQRVQETFQDRVKQILCPPRAAMAVVRGAVYFGLNPRLITSRVSRRTYGINAGLPFDESIDPPSSRVIRPDGSIRCTTRFLVFVKKGDVIPVDHCIKERMFVYYGTIKATDILLYATEEDREPRYYDEPGVKQVAAISVPIPYMPRVAHGERVAYTVR
ncbi:hypothetical protein BCV72DRAFT_250807 [Rhizopus microsporus var. microsporus]|uniref:Actin-like ATPase domain-containing protein n=2 Tax=Rhizopus microsporus TaxID=58291 RepID=A0A2G4SEN9_RHIZD|nr:uncharacterized protein RHIMIDRAFT_249998 [Rhizopus microsporus ATCC 52813]ORE05092.1 hypothetical protein BCV72DRAFT_250807 [Rhizopus microsporus var. microsporus]PHZ07254.1 hypothetical protein RHIMIDRAFT_249998 [Rhizopus microsporus ATCC 52813]